MSGSLSPRHLLSLAELSPATFESLLDAAERLRGPRGREPLLAGRRFGMVFFNASLRTRTAFEVASFDLGAHAVYLQVGGGLWSLEHRSGVVMDGAHAEHVKEGFGVLSRMLDAVGVRAFASLTDADEDARDAVIRSIAAASTVPVLNLESAMDHPHQGLADALTVRRQLIKKHSLVGFAILMALSLGATVHEVNEVTGSCDGLSASVTVEIDAENAYLVLLDGVLDPAQPEPVHPRNTATVSLRLQRGSRADPWTLVSFDTEQVV